MGANVYGAASCARHCVRCFMYLISHDVQNNTTQWLLLPGLVTHACNHSTQEAKVGGSL